MRKQSTLHLPVVFADAPAVFSPFDNCDRVSHELKIYDVTYLHFHRHLELGLCISGEGICQVEDEMFPFSAGDVQIIFPYQRHISKNTGDTPSVWYWVSVDIAEALFRAGFANQENLQQWMHKEMALCGIIDKERHGAICQRVKDIFAILINRVQDCTHPTERFAGMLLDLILQLCDASRSLPKLNLHAKDFAASLSPALEQINEDVKNGQMPKVKDLPVLCNMSPANFRRVFERTLGLSPKAYITQCCIHKAKKLLACTDTPISQIASEIGYENISGFNRCFLEHAGVSPREFRQMMQT